MTLNIIGIFVWYLVPSSGQMWYFFYFKSMRNIWPLLKFAKQISQWTWMCIHSAWMGQKNKYEWATSCAYCMLCLCPLEGAVIRISYNTLHHLIWPLDGAEYNRAYFLHSLNVITRHIALDYTSHHSLLQHAPSLMKFSWCKDAACVLTHNINHFYIFF